MPTDAKRSLLYLFAILPSLFSFLSVVPMFFYRPTGKKLKEIVASLEGCRQKSLDGINRL